MAELFTTLVPNLIQGVSQQPDAQRDPSQAELQVNGVSSSVEGLRKRDPSQTLAKVSATLLGDVFVHPILRDANEKYLAVVSSNSVKVFDLAGVQQTVNAPGGYSYLSTVTDAKRQIRCATIADYTFISNTLRVTAADAALAPAVARPAANEALVWIKAANYGQSYRVNLNGILATVTTAVASVITSGGVVTSYPISAASIAAQISAALLHGAATALTFTATAITVKGPAAALTATGSSTTLNGTKSALTTTTDGSGSGLTVNVTGNGSVVSAVTMTNSTGGVGYQAGAKVFVARSLLEGGTDTTPVQVATVQINPKTNLGTTTDGDGSGLLVNVTGNATTITAATIGTSGGVGYQAGAKVFVARSLLEGGTDTTPVQVATVATAGAGALSGVAIARSGSVLHFTSANPITISATDARANADITAITNSCQAFTELPTIAPAGYQVAITGDPGNQFDGFYVKFVPRTGLGTFGEGAWEETVAPGCEYKLDPASMPHILVRLPSGQFHFGPVNGAALTALTLPSWGERVAGDYETAPDPSFVGQAINDIFIYKNRLGILADEGVILSRAKSLFSFFPETVTTILDSDPIDRIASNNRVSVLRYAVPFQDELILFSDQYQFRFNSAEATLTPATAQITVLTQYEIDPTVRPIQVAGTIVFAQANGEWTQFREFSVRGVGTALVADAASLTDYASSYIPSGVFQLTGNDTGNAWYAISEKAGYTKRIYTYKYLYRNQGNGPERAQSSWSYWEFSGADKVLAILCITEKLYLLTQQGAEIFLEVIPVLDRQSVTAAPYVLLLDRLVSTTASTPPALRVAAGVYNLSTRTTTWTLPFTIRALTQAWSAYQVGYQGGSLLGSASNGNTITANGDWSGAQVYFGEAFTFIYILSRFKTMRAQGGGLVASNMLRAQVRHAKLRYHETGWFQVRVIPKGNRAVGLYPFPGSTTSLLEGADACQSGVFVIPIMGRGEDVQVQIENDTAHPCKFSTVEWIGLITGKGRPM